VILFFQANASGTWDFLEEWRNDLGTIWKRVT